MKKMLINANEREEVRVALVDGQRLYDLDIENRARPDQSQCLYAKSYLRRTQPRSRFRGFCAERHGLPLKEIAHQHYAPSSPRRKDEIKNAIKEGTEALSK